MILVLKITLYKGEGKQIIMGKPLLIIVNGLPGTGKTTLARRLAVVSSLLAAGQALIVEGFFGRSELRSAEFLQLQRTYDFEPFQIVCKADGAVLLERFLSRVGTGERHAGHPDLEWIEQNKERLLQEHLPPLGGPVVEIDTTTPHSFDYADLLQRVHAALFNTLTR